MDKAIRREWDTIRDDIEKEYAKYMLPVAVQEAFILLLSVGCIVLHDYFGFGKKRLNTWVDHVLDYQDSLHRGKDYLTIDEVAEEMQRLTGQRYALTAEDVDILTNFGMEGLIEEIRLMDNQIQYMDQLRKRGWTSNVNRYGVEVV